jgi:hypothetical protein
MKLALALLILTACEMRQSITAPCSVVVERFEPPKADTVAKVTVDSLACPRR